MLSKRQLVHQNSQRPNVRLGVVIEVLREDFRRNPEPGIRFGKSFGITACTINETIGVAEQGEAAVTWAQEAVEDCAWAEGGLR